jgi:hypothetical protein
MRLDISITLYNHNSFDSISTLPATMPTKDEFVRSLQPLTCSICLEPYDTEHFPTEMPGCRHVFGAPCIKTLINTQPPNNNRCPLCRGELFQVGYEVSDDEEEYDDDPGYDFVFDTYEEEEEDEYDFSNEYSETEVTRVLAFNRPGPSPIPNPLAHAAYMTTRDFTGLEVLGGNFDELYDDPIYDYQIENHEDFEDDEDDLDYEDEDDEDQSQYVYSETGVASLLASSHLGPSPTPDPPGHAGDVETRVNTGVENIDDFDNETLDPGEARALMGRDEPTTTENGNSQEQMAQWLARLRLEDEEML